MKAGIDRKNCNFFRNKLIPETISKVKIPSTGRPLQELLQSGINIAEIGCGKGASTIAMAKAFPKSRIYAFEASARELDAMKKNVQNERLSNVTVCDGAKHSLADGPTRHFIFIPSSST